MAGKKESWLAGSMAEWLSHVVMLRTMYMYAHVDSHTLYIYIYIYIYIPIVYVCLLRGHGIEGKKWNEGYLACCMPN